MRLVSFQEKKQRGCVYCIHMQIENFGKGKGLRTACPLDECPYTVLDKYKSYEEFMASEDSKILVNEFFATVADCYMLSANPNKQKRIFSDGDAKMHI